MENLKKIEFGEIAELRKEKFNPETSTEIKPCLELEHFEQVTGKINGFVPSSEQKSIKNVFYKGDVLFGKLRPYLRKYWLAEFDGVCSSEVWVLKPKSKDISNEYLSNLIQTNDFIQAANVSSGSKMPRADWNYIVNFPFSIINSKTEQKAIAQVLSTADAAIHTTEKLIAQKELRKKWLMQQLLTGKKRLKGFSGEWKEKKLGKLFSQIKNVNDGGDSHSIMTISSKLGMISQEDKFDRVIAGDSLKKYTQLVKGDFAYNKGNSKTYPMGCIYRLEEKESALVPFVYICFSPTKLVDGLFYKHWFLAHGLDRQLNKIITSGARGDGLLNVNTDDFFGLKIIYPPIEEQTAIAQVLQAVDKEISLLKAKAEKLREQKKGLMQVLLTGKVRLKINNG